MRKTVFKISVGTVIIFSLLLFSLISASAKSPTISTKSKSLKVGKTFVIKVSDISKTVKWSSSKSSVAKIISKGGAKNCKIRIKALKAGSATITAKIGDKKLKCKIKVKAKKKPASYDGGGTVYITATGEKYHSLGCRYLRSRTAVSLSWAKAHGYSPCSACQ